MRNYRGYNKMGVRDRQCQCTLRDKNSSTNTTRESKAVKSKDVRSKVIIDENTIYEIDMDCYECLMKNKNKIK